MTIKRQLEIAIAHAREVDDIYRLNYLGSNNTSRSVDILREISQGYLGKRVEYYTHPMSYNAGQAIRGFCLKFPEHYEIALLSGQNFCWTRLVLSKEIFQVLIDKPEYRTHDIAGLIEQAIISFPAPTSDDNLPLLSESLAEIASMEFLFPYKERDALIVSLQGQDPDYAAIADRYKLPRVMVERYLSKSLMAALKL